MTKVVALHQVVDVDKWLQGKAGRRAMIGRFATNIQDYVAQDGSNQVALSFDVDDEEGLAAMATSPSPEDAAAMEARGVIPPVIAFVAR